jgi:hypothetical protein
MESRKRTLELSKDNLIKDIIKLQVMRMQMYAPNKTLTEEEFDEAFQSYQQKTMKELKEIYEKYIYLTQKYLDK